MALNPLMAFLAPGQPPSYITGFKPGFSTKMTNMFAEMPPDIKATITSGARSIQRQAQLYAAAIKKYGSPEAARKWVAPPGKSQHNLGSAADLRFASPAARKWIHANAAKYGLAFPMKHEPWHIEDADARGGGHPEPIHPDEMNQLGLPTGAKADGARNQLGQPTGQAAADPQDDPLGLDYVPGTPPGGYYGQTSDAFASLFGDGTTSPLLELIPDPPPPVPTASGYAGPVPEPGTRFRDVLNMHLDDTADS